MKDRQKHHHIRIPLGKPEEYQPMPMPFGAIENIDGYDYWTYDIGEMEALVPTLKDFKEKYRQRLTEMNNEVFTFLEKPFREDKLTLGSIQRFKSHILDTWKIREIEDYYRFSVATRFSANADDQFRYPLVDSLFADFAKMAALLGGALLYSGIVGKSKADGYRVWGGKIDDYDSLFLDKTYKEALSLLPGKESAILDGLINQKADESISQIVNALESIRNGQTEMKEMLEVTKKVAESTQSGTVWLVNDRKGRIKRNREHGREYQANGMCGREVARVKGDIKKALNRVHERVTENVKVGKPENVLGECRLVCKNFAPLTAAKKYGKSDCLPLTKVGGGEIKPTTLAKYYRSRYGTKRNRKVRAKT